MADSIVEEWLRSLKLVNYTQDFLDNGYDDLEVCKQIGDPDLDAIGVVKTDHREIILEAVKSLQEEGGISVYFTLEEQNNGQVESEYCEQQVQGAVGFDTYEGLLGPSLTPATPGPKLRSYPKLQLFSIIRDKLIEDDIRLHEEPYHGADDSFEHLECLATRYAGDLHTGRADVLHQLQELQKNSLKSQEAGNQSPCGSPTKEGYALHSIYGQSARSVPPPLPVRPPPAHTYADPAELEVFTKKSPLVSPRRRRSGSAAMEHHEELFADMDWDSTKWSVLGRFFRSRRSARKYIYRPHDGDLHASEITMSEEDRIQLMVLVKEGKLSMEQAVEAVKQYEKRKRLECSRKGSADGSTCSEGALPSSPHISNKFSPFPFLKLGTWRRKKGDHHRSSSAHLVSGSPSSISESGFASCRRDISPDRLSSHTLTTTSELACYRHDSPTHTRQYASSVVEQLNRVTDASQAQHHQRAFGIFGSPLRLRKGSQPVMSSTQQNGPSLMLSCRHASLPGTPTLLSPRDRRRSNTPANRACFVPLPNVDGKLKRTVSKAGGSQHVVTAIVHTSSNEGCGGNYVDVPGDDSSEGTRTLVRTSHNNNDNKSPNINNKHTYENFIDEEDTHSRVTELNCKNTLEKSHSDTFAHTRSGTSIMIIKDSPNSKYDLDPVMSKLGHRQLRCTIDRVSPDLGVDTSPTGTLDGDDSRSAGFGSSSTMSMGSDISPSLDKRKLYPLLDKTQRSGSFSTGEEFFSSDYEDPDDLEKTLERDSGRGSLSEKASGEKVKVKERIASFRTSCLLQSQARNESPERPDQTRKGSNASLSSEASPKHASRRTSPKPRKARPRTVEELLQRLGLQHLLPLFVANGFETLDLFSQLDNHDLDDLGISSAEERVKILTAAELLLDYEGVENNVSRRSTPTSTTSSSSAHSPVTLVEQTPEQEQPSTGLGLSPDEFDSTPTSSQMPIYLKQDVSPQQVNISEGRNSLYANVSEQLLVCETTQRKSSGVDSKVSSICQKPAGYSAAVNKSSQRQCTNGGRNSQGLFSTFRPPEVENEHVTGDGCEVTGEDQEVISITNGTKENRRYRRCISQPQESFSRLAFTCDEHSIQQSSQTDLPMHTAKEADNCNGHKSKTKVKKARARSESGPRIPSADSPQRYGNSPTGRLKTSSVRHIPRSSRSDIGSSPDQFKMGKKQGPKVPQRTVSLTSKENGEASPSKVVRSGIRPMQKDRVNRSKAHSMAGVPGSSSLSSFRPDPAIKPSQNGTAAEKPYVSQSLEILVAQKLEGECIDLRQPPYTDQNGACGIPVPLVLRYSEEMQKDGRQMAAAVELNRIKQLQASSMPVIASDGIVEKCCSGVIEYNLTSVPDFLHSCGLPMCADCLAKSGYNSIESLQMASDKDLLQSGIRDHRYRKRLSHILEVVKVNPCTSNKCVVVHKKGVKGKGRTVSSVVDKV